MAEFLKELTLVRRKDLREIINQICHKGELPTGWEGAGIGAIHKARDEDKTSNYRGFPTRHWVQNNQENNGG